MATSSNFTHSKQLFLKEDGSTIQFYMCPCPERAKLKPLVEHGGGSISNKRMKNSVLLTADLRKAFTGNEDFYSPKYIHDCVKHNRLLRMTNYKLYRNEKSASSSTDDDLDISDDMSPAATIIRTEAKNFKGRKEYRLSDDMAMITYIMSERRHSETGGNRLWNDMEMLGITKHTAQSMRARFLKITLPRISTYTIPGQWISTLKGNTKTARSPLKFHGSPTVTSSTEKNTAQKTVESSPRKQTPRKQLIISESSSDEETAAVTSETNNRNQFREETTTMVTRNRQHSAQQNDLKNATNKDTTDSELSEPSCSKHKMTLRKEVQNVEQQVMECTSTGSPRKATLRIGGNVHVIDEEQQRRHLPTRSSTVQKVTTETAALETVTGHKKSLLKINAEVHNERGTSDVSSPRRNTRKTGVAINAVVVSRNSAGTSPSSRRLLRDVSARKQPEKNVSRNQNRMESSGIPARKANAETDGHLAEISRKCNEPGHTSVQNSPTKSLSKQSEKPPITPTSDSKVSSDIESDSSDEYLIEIARRYKATNTIGDRNDKVFRYGRRDKLCMSPSKAPKVDVKKSGHNSVRKSPVKSFSKQPLASHDFDSDCSDEYLFEIARKRKPKAISSDSSDQEQHLNKKGSHPYKFRKLNANNPGHGPEEKSPVTSPSKQAAKSPRKTWFISQSKTFPQKSSKQAVSSNGATEISSNHENSSNTVKDSKPSKSANVSKTNQQLGPKKDNVSSVKTSKPIQNVTVCGSKTTKRKLLASAENANTTSQESSKQSKKVSRPCASRDDTSKSKYTEEWVQNYSSEDGEELVAPSTVQRCLNDLSDTNDMLSQSVEADSSSQEIMMPVRKVQECPTEMVDIACDIVKELAAAFRLPTSDVVFALSANRGDVVTTVEWLTTGIAKNGKFDWRPEEDRLLLNSDSDAIEKLLERHDLESIEQRASFLEDLSLTL